ncbi:2-oxoglutarate dehydrogenase E1 component [Blattabacterium cuenoti]|uniref:2-oxoglutarate dehydrogenase E1 component n=1 Tax=Blattabacterium cuenoti TaxID=1653831 RepID=UPI00163BB718|nr:2-oxoglutarate dehydrogenase E1 component [Blattabacterium cuenoti]
MKDRYSFLNAIHFKDIESLYEEYKKDPHSLESSWRNFFCGFDFGQKNGLENPIIKNNNEKKTDFHGKMNKEFIVYNLIQYYRKKGHLFAYINPIIKNQRIFPSLESFGLSKKELNEPFQAGKLSGICDEITSLKNIIHSLENIYCKSIGIEYMYILDSEKINWIEKWFLKNSMLFSSKEKFFFLKKLHESVCFENFIHKKFVGQKRFSIEGNESILPALESIIEYASKKYLTKNFIMGMSHRGRLNVLSNFLKKDFSQIFSEFHGKEYKEKNFSGDVKYHLGFFKNRKTFGGIDVEIYLVPNPSHLETVTSVVEGMSKAIVDLYHNNDQKKYQKVIPILIHGDASLSGQGVVYEVLQLSKLDGYQTGGTLHIVINNQIGFTTSPEEGRSSMYCTDVAKVMMSPVIHVNAYDIESVMKSIFFAIDFRMRYHEDVFIDLIGYRKYGHNEGDEPRFTQPILYKMISKYPSIYDVYKKKLKKEGILNQNDIENMEKEYEQILDKKYQYGKNVKWNTLNYFLIKNWENYPIVFDHSYIFKKVNTKFSKDKIIEISKKIFTLPKKKKFFKKTKNLFQKRLHMVNHEKCVDWSIAELLAYATILYEGRNIRLSGEDVVRGTFSHRHAMIKTENEENIFLLNHIGNGKMQVVNSPLSEYGVLGFDYGYSMVSPNVLTLWEAQFGDFGNGGQIIIDQYISSGESKWKIRNGIVLLLPHGYEGQGPEHSSARIERYLQLCAKNNIFAVNCTSPSNFYHVLRRQVKLPYRKPLIIFTPKSLLRNKKCLSSINDLSEGSFQEVIDDLTIIDKNKIQRIILCSGKIYYDLLNKREFMENTKIALIRIEQIYPLNIKKLHQTIFNYKKINEIFWVQEEPKNMGLWSYIFMNLGNSIPIRVIAPSENCSPATGSYENFLKIHNNILEQAFI